jgi:hypothetical protein
MPKSRCHGKPRPLAIASMGTDSWRYRCRCFTPKFSHETGSTCSFTAQVDPVSFCLPTETQGNEVPAPHIGVAQPGRAAVSKTARRWFESSRLCKSSPAFIGTRSHIENSTLEEEARESLEVTAARGRCPPGCSSPGNPGDGSRCEPLRQACSRQPRPLPRFMVGSHSPADWT